MQHERPHTSHPGPCAGPIAPPQSEVHRVISEADALAADRAANVKKMPSALSKEKLSTRSIYKSNTRTCGERGHERKA